MRIKEKLERSKEKITAYGGSILLRKLEDDLKLKQTLNRIIHDSRPRSYKPSDIILPTILMLHTGGNCLEDLARMAEDKMLCSLHNLKHIPHPTTISRWCNYHGTDTSGESNNHPDKPDSPTLQALDRLLITLARKSIHKSGQKNVTLDIDWTGIETHKQESKWSYKGKKSMGTLTGFIAETGICVGNWFRNGNISPLDDNEPLLAHIISGLEQGNNIRIARFRSDSAGYQAKVINTCEAHNITFAIRGKMDAAVVKLISSIKETDWKPLIGKNGHQIPGQKVASVIHTMEKTEKSFRMVIVRKEKRQLKETKKQETENTTDTRDILETNHFTYFATATNSELPDSLLIHFYNNRGSCEQDIREAKYGFSLKHLPMSALRGNAVWSAIVMLAYNLGILLKQMELNIHPLSMRIQTIRYRLYQVPGKLVRINGKLIVRLFCSKKRFAVFREALLECSFG